MPFGGPQDVAGAHHVGLEHLRIGSDAGGAKVGVGRIGDRFVECRQMDHGVAGLGGPVDSNGVATSTEVGFA